MKTKELIRQLMEADPTGEEECCVGNIDIHFVSKEPAYYDGTLQVLKRDPSKLPYYNIVGGEYVRSGFKVQIHTLSIVDILDDPEATLEYEKIGELALIEKYKVSDEKTRLIYKKIQTDSEWYLFCRWAKEKAEKISGDPLDETTARFFFDKHIDPNCDLPTEKTENEKAGKCAFDSYNNRRKLQWDNSISLEFEGMDWKFERITK